MGGAQEVVRQLSERLASFGHEVTVATTKLPDRSFTRLHGVDIAEFDIRGNEVNGFQGDVQRYQEFLRNGKYDVMMNYAAQQWTADLAFPLLSELGMRKVLVPCGFSALYNEQYRAYYEKMRTRLGQYDACVYLSEHYRDINFAREAGVVNDVLIPNGASLDEFDKPAEMDIRRKLGIPPDHFLLLHVGSHTGLKGHHEAIEAFKKARIKNATLLIVANVIKSGRGCYYQCMASKLLHSFSLREYLDGKRLLIASFPRCETVAAYKEADLFLFPSHVECSPLVLFEANAASTPFLTTDVGNAKEIIEWTGGGLLLPTTLRENGESMADVNGTVRMLEELYSNPLKLRGLAEAGRRAWQDRFTWEAIARRYEELYTRLIHGEGPKSL